LPPLSSQPSPMAMAEHDEEVAPLAGDTLEQTFISRDARGYSKRFKIFLLTTVILAVGLGTLMLHGWAGGSAKIQAALLHDVQNKQAVGLVSDWERYPYGRVVKNGGYQGPHSIFKTALWARTQRKYMEIKARLVDSFREIPEVYHPNPAITTYPRSNVFACVLRLAGHDFMDFDGQTAGGSDGCMDLTVEDNDPNKHLLCLEGIRPSLIDVYLQFQFQVSFADFVVIAAETVMAESSNDPTLGQRFKANFQWGRITAMTCPSVKRNIGNQPLPDPGRACAANEETFIKNLGLTWAETAALMGVHTLGGAHLDRSGFDGFWSDRSNSLKFNNDYYKSMVQKGWAPERTSAGRAQWRRVGTKGHNTNREMMLNTDMCLAFGYDLKSEDTTQDSCCAWAMPQKVHGSWPNAWCAVRPNETSPQLFDTMLSHCCGGVGSRPCNTNPQKLDGPAAAEVLSFATSERVWLDTFLQAWWKATRVITLPKCPPDTNSRCHEVLQNGVCSKVPSTLCPTTCRVNCQP